MSAPTKWRLFYACAVENPETGGFCQIEVESEDAVCPGPHLHSEWRDGEIVGPVWWGPGAELQSFGRVGS